MSLKNRGAAESLELLSVGRLRDWLYALCVELFWEHGIAVSTDAGFQVRVFDAITVQEPGRTGSQGHVHYSVNLPSLGCDFFKLTPTDGRSTGESFKQFPIPRTTTSWRTEATRLPSGFSTWLGQVETLQQSGPVGRWSARTVASTGPTVAAPTRSLAQTQ
ncbi:MAG: hypothetical protein OXH92_12925 [Bryobacterales bacterium]|nr:hypothetical protein [Bryobacterales bacterium]